MGVSKCLILFHGAGGDRDHPTFKFLETELEIPVERINFPYRKLSSGRRPPDRMPKLVNAVNEAVDNACAEYNLEPGDIVVGGRSMGGRACSMAIAEGLSVKGLLLLSYPLHPVGKPDKLRVEHFPDVDCPVLLVQGLKDPFGKPEEFAEHLPKIAGDVSEVWIKSGHDPKGFDETILENFQNWEQQF